MEKQSVEKNTNMLSDVTSNKWVISIIVSIVVAIIIGIILWFVNPTFVQNEEGKPDATKVVLWSIAITVFLWIIWFGISYCGRK